MFLKAKTFLKEAWAEMKRVNWPTRSTTIRLTIVVIIISLLMAALLGFFDIIFTHIIDSYLIF